MADLSYGDVQRAVQDGTRDMRGSLNRLAQQTQRIEALENQVITMRRELDFVRRQALNINTQIVGLGRPAPAAGTDQRMWQQLGNGLHAIDARLIVMQRYMQDVSTYLALQQDRNTDEQHFQSP